MDGDLKSKCQILPQLGKSTQFILSTQASTEPEQNVVQQDMDNLVTELIHRELPRLRACHQRKITAILTEARAKVKAYLAAHEALKMQSANSQSKLLYIFTSSYVQKTVRRLITQCAVINCSTRQTSRRCGCIEQVST